LPATAKSDMMAPAELKLELTCGNCGRPWPDRDDRWRSYLDDEGNANVFCPDCANRAFDCDKDEDE
jgi:hypothetical protein